MTRSLVGRLTLLQQLTALAAIAAFALMALWVTAHVMRSERRAFAASTASRLAASFDEDLADDPDSLLAAQSLVEDGLEVGVQVEVRDPSGRLLASSPAPSGDRSRELAPRGSPPGEAFRASATNPNGLRVTVTATDEARAASLSALGRSLLIAALPILALSLLLGRAIVARALRPLSTMAERAAGLSLERNPRSLGTHTGLEETDRLARSFDHLLERLDDALLSERRLTADVSHELRTPLTVLGGELELLIERATPGTAEASGLRSAAEQVGAMRELVEAILLLHRSREAGRTDHSEFEVLNLCDLTRELLAEALARHPERERDLTIEALDEVLVRGQTALLASAVRNLLDNAFKFTGRGDRVRVEVAGAGDRAIVTVEDAGAGIPEAERERIFDPFYRGAEARAATRGFGLGLPILRRVARAHGGDVEVTTSALGGARFALSLPNYEAERRGG